MEWAGKEDALMQELRMIQTSEQADLEYPLSLEETITRIITDVAMDLGLLPEKAEGEEREALPPPPEPQ